jgi:hypothetical protein
MPSFLSDALPLALLLVAAAMEGVGVIRSPWHTRPWER